MSKLYRVLLGKIQIDTACEGPVCGISTGPEDALCSGLDLLLQGSNWVGFHNGPCWLGLHLLLLTEHHPDTSFCCWLHPVLHVVFTGNSSNQAALCCHPM